MRKSDKAQCSRPDSLTHGRPRACVCAVQSGADVEALAASTTLQLEHAREMDLALHLNLCRGGGQTVPWLKPHCFASLPEGN